MDAPVHQIPPELLRMILKHVANDYWRKRDLLACSSICSKWRLQALPLILESVSFTIDGQRTVTEERDLAMFQAIIDLYPGIGNAVHTIQFIFGAVKNLNTHTKDFFFRLVTLFPTKCMNIKTLVICNAHSSKGWRITELRKSLRHFSTVETIEFHDCTLRVTDLCTFSAALPRLTQLEFGRGLMLDKRQISLMGGDDVTKGKPAIRSLRLRFVDSAEHSNPGLLCDTLQSGHGLFRNITALSIGFDAFDPPMNHFGAYIVSLGPILRHLEVWGCFGVDFIHSRRMDLVRDLALDLSQSSSLVSLVLGFEDIKTSSFEDALKGVVLNSLRFILWRIPERAEDELRNEFTAVAQSLPSLVEKLYFFDPDPTVFQHMCRSHGGSGSLAKGWEATMKDIFASAILRGVDVQTMVLSHETRDDACTLAHQWGKAASFHALSTSE